MSKFGRKAGEVLRTERLKDARQHRKLTQEELAAACEVSKSQIQKYERGINDPTSESLRRLAQALGVSADWLIGLADDPSPRAVPELTDAQRFLIDRVEAIHRTGKLDMNELAEALQNCIFEQIGVRARQQLAELDVGAFLKQLEQKGAEIGR